MGAISGIMGLVGAAAPATTTQAGGATAAGKVAGGGNNFGDTIVGALDSLQAVQSNADNLAVKAATGSLTDVHDYTIAAAEANLATEFTVALRNRAVETFNDIMRMQI